MHIETGRFKTVTDQETGIIRSMKVAERLCLICKSNIVEDEKHFLFHCPMYITERNKFYDSCSRGNNNFIIVSPVRSTYGGYYGLVVVPPPRAPPRPPPRAPPRPQTLHRSHDNLKNPYRIASIFYM